MKRDLETIYSFLHVRTALRVLLLTLPVICALSFPLTTALAGQPASLLSNGQALDMQGNPVPTAAAASGSATSSSASSTGSDLSLLSVPPEHELSQADIVATLNKLFEWGPATTRYAQNFIMLPGLLNIKDDTKSNVLSAPVGSVYIYKPYNLANPNIGLKVQRIPELVPLFAFQGDTGNAIFVWLDGFGIRVPIAAAELEEAAFISGLTTRLLLGEYSRAWNKAGNHELSPTGLNFNTTVFSNLLADQYALAANWPDKVTYDDALKNLLANFPVHPAGVLWGWHAGEDLDKLTGPDVAYRDAVWKLIGGRFGFDDIGTMTAYTLNYMVGYAKNQRITALSQGTATDVLQDNAKILEHFASDTNINLANALVSGFQNCIVGEFYALSQNKIMNLEEKRLLLARYYAFIRGLNLGSQQAADQLYIDVFRLAYGIGYQTGFKDGYAQGYAAGFKDGYAAGYSKAWAEANVVIGRLQNQINTLQGQLDSANNNNDFFGTVTKAANAVGTVVGVIASIFG